MAMTEALIASKIFNAQTEIIEPISGNNGVPCAWICAMKAIKLTIVIPEHMSIERQKLIIIRVMIHIITIKALVLRYHLGLNTKQSTV
jgi:cysteine synthase A